LNYAIQFNNVGVLKACTGNFNEALANFKVSRGLLTALFKKNNYFIGVTLANLAFISMKFKDWNSCIKIFRAVWKSCFSVFLQNLETFESIEFKDSDLENSLELDIQSNLLVSPHSNSNEEHKTNIFDDYYSLMSNLETEDGFIMKCRTNL